MKRAYLVGPMSGLPEGNFPKFRAAAADLRQQGIEVVSPVEMNEADGEAAVLEPGHPRRAEFLARDVTVVADPDVDSLVVLDGWEKSIGARLEVSVARALGKDVYAYPHLTLLPVAEEGPLEEAQRIVHGERADSYGHPADHFAHVAGLWSALFGWDVEAKDVPLAMVCFKLSRLRHNPGHRDTVVDMAGYLETLWMLMERDRS